MPIIKVTEVIELVLKETKYRLPEKIILDSLNLVYAPEHFMSEYKKNKRNVDKYFMHLSNPEISELELHQLTEKMHPYDATLELKLISAKLLRCLQELATFEKGFEIDFLNSETVEWLSYVYFNEGNLIQRLKEFKL